MNAMLAFAALAFAALGIILVAISLERLLRCGGANLISYNSAAAANPSLFSFYEPHNTKRVRFAEPLVTDYF